MKKTEFSYIPFINIARFFAILLVVVGHISHQKPIVNCLYSFHIPLFFFLSGLLFKPNQNIIEFIVKRFKRLIIPFIILYVISLILYYLVEKQFRDLPVDNEFYRLIPLIYGSNINNLLIINIPLWFLPALFTCEVISNIVITKLKYFSQKIILIILIGSVGFILSKLKIWNLPFGLSPALIMIPFYFIGYLSKSVISRINSRVISSLLFIISVVLLSILIINIERNDIASGVIPNIPLFICTSFIGTLCIISLSILINKSKYLETLGLGDVTLIILGLHGIIGRVMLTIVNKWGGGRQ